MTQPITPAKECPVCKSTKLQPSKRQTVGKLPVPVFGVLSYRCENGHVFTSADNMRS
jgi:hypothetical protein